MIRTPVTPSTSYGQMVIVLALLGSMPTAFVQQGMPVLFPFIQEDFGTTRAQLGLIAAGLGLGGIATAILMGWVADALGIRMLLPVTLMVVAAELFLFSQIQSLVQGVLLALFIGVVGSATGPATAKAIMDWIRPRVRGLSMGINQTSVPISGLIAAGLFPLLSVHFSWRSAVLVLAIFTALASIVFFLFYRDKPGSSSKGERGSLVGSIALLAKNRAIWLTSFSYAALLAVHVVFVSYVILFLIEDQGMSKAVASGFLGIAWTGSIVGRVMWGLVSDLLGGRRVVVGIFVCLMSMLGMTFMSLLPLDAPRVMIGMVIFLVGSTALAWPGLYNALVVELSGPGVVATAFAYVSIIARAGAFVPPLFGLVVDRTGSYDIGWWMMAGIASAAALLLAFVRPHPQLGSAR